ncbi:MAG: MFS transporter [Nanoarchaeota archaeon]|nr:MFS transporter [Nanoarchaeota archaeon]
MNRYILFLLLSNSIWVFGSGLLGPLYTVFAQRIGGDILELSAAYALFLITTGVLSIIIGKISDHHSKRRLLLAGFIINMIATFSYILVDTPLKLFVVQAALGVAAALAGPTWDSLFSKHVDKKQIGTEWGLYEGGTPIITGIALILGALVITYTNFVDLFLIMGTIQVVATLTFATSFLHPKR